MDSIKEAITAVTGWVRNLTELGISLILALLVIDVLFPNTTNLVQNIGEIVGQFSEPEGLVGLIALLLFLMLFKK